MIIYRMKTAFTLATSLLLLILSSCSHTFSDSKGSYSKYESVSNFKKVFQISDGNTFVDYYLIQGFTFNSLQYSARVRVYSYTDVDTAYFRESQEGLVYVDPETFVETVDLPKNPQVGQKWQEPSNWVYEIKSINASLQTPDKEFTNLIEIEAKQTTGESREKFTKYNNFYAEGIGYVGSMVNGTVFSYLTEAVEIAQAKEE